MEHTDIQQSVRALWERQRKLLPEVSDDVKTKMAHNAALGQSDSESDSSTSDHEEERSERIGYKLSNLA